MMIKGRVQGGRLIVDEPTALPEGTEIELVPFDHEDGLDDAERAELHEALAESQEDIKAGRLVDAVDVLKGLRAR